MFRKNTAVILQCCIAATLGGCKYRDAYPTLSDSEMKGKLTDRNFKAIFQEVSGGEWEDVVKGSGREDFQGGE